MQSEAGAGYYAEFVHRDNTIMVFFRSTEGGLEGLARRAVAELGEVYGANAARMYALDLLYSYEKRHSPVYRRGKSLTADKTVEKVSPTNSVPGLTLRERISKIIRDRIETGIFEPDRPMPSQRELALEFGTSPRTIGLAAADLSKQGYLTVSPGLGTYPRPKEEWQSVKSSNVKDCFSRRSNITDHQPEE